ncbi:MAG: hypothetical protein FH756_14415 [Firmicutes bacterium]|nr:hypothetical protein [Bacillota bacterium]
MSCLESISTRTKTLPAGGTVVVLSLTNPAPEPPNPISSIWHEKAPVNCRFWHLNSWIDRDGNGELSKGDIIDLLRTTPVEGADFGPKIFGFVLQAPEDIGEINDSNGRFLVIVILETEREVLGPTGLQDGGARDCVSQSTGIGGSINVNPNISPAINPVINIGSPVNSQENFRELLIENNELLRESVELLEEINESVIDILQLLRREECDFDVLCEPPLPGRPAVCSRRPQVGDIVKFRCQVEGSICEACIEAVQVTQTTVVGNLLDDLDETVPNTCMTCGLDVVGQGQEGDPAGFTYVVAGNQNIQGCSNPE